MNGRQVRAVHVRRAGDDEHHEHHGLDSDDHGVGVGRLLDADDEQRGHEQHDDSAAGRLKTPARRAVASERTAGIGDAEIVQRG